MFSINAILNLKRVKKYPNDTNMILILQDKISERKWQYSNWMGKPPPTPRPPPFALRRARDSPAAACGRERPAGGRSRESWVGASGAGGPPGGLKGGKPRGAVAVAEGSVRREGLLGPGVCGRTGQQAAGS